MRGVASPNERKAKPYSGHRHPAVHPKRQQANPSPVGKFLRWLTYGLTFTTVVTASAGLGATMALVAPFPFISENGTNQSISIPELFRQGLQHGISRPVNILVLGVDLNTETPENGEPLDPFKSRSDTMLLARCNPDDDQVSLLSIPRDTRVDIPDVGTTKINSANYWGGAELAADVVSNTLNNVPVDRYIRINTGAFRELVDVMGGVEVFVPIAMQYEDQTQDLKIDLEPGLQTLDGTEAEGFIRYRNSNLGDIGRMQRQQILLKALQKKFTNPLALAKLPQILSVLQKHIDTDLSMGEILALTQFSLQRNPEQFRMVLLPGRFSGPEEYEYSFWLADWSGIDRVMQSYFDVAPPMGYEVASGDPMADYDLKIVVQNASGEPDGSDRMANYLASIGFHNVHYGNSDWPEILSETQIIPQWGELDAANRLQSVLNDSQVTANSTGALSSDLTIRVGRDWFRGPQAQEFEGIQETGGQDI